MANFDIPPSSPINNNTSSSITKITKQEQSAITKAKQLLTSGSEISYVAEVTGLSIQTITLLKRSEGL